MHPPQPLGGPVTSPARRGRLCAAIDRLIEARGDARYLDRDVWEFALTARELYAAGLTGTDLRWLVASGFLSHAVERLRYSGGRREFRPAPDLSVTGRSCYVLTAAGTEFAAVLNGTAAPAPRPPAGLSPAAPRPAWDNHRRELSWQGELVKVFRSPAPCQELILTAFEEEAWPPRIDDPLGGVAGRTRQERLHDAVRGLNRFQRGPRIKFTRDGTGQGVLWAP